MALKDNNDEGHKSSKDQNSKLKSYITKKFKKFIKNANVKMSDKDHKQSGFSQSKSQDKFKRESKEGGQSSNILVSPKCYGCQGYVHMMEECPTYLKSTGESKALVATLSDTEPEANSEDSDQEGTFMAFTTTIYSSKESEELIDKKEDSKESKFEKMDEKR